MQQRDIQTNGITLHITEQGQGPLVVLCHGWPELAYSWRHQLPALANAGFHAVAPDMRGYGRSSAPHDVEAYDLSQLTGDIVGLVAALGYTQAIVIGHDWGAPVAWGCALMRPDLFTHVVAMSVPHRGRAPAKPLEVLKKNKLDNFYWCYFQEPGVAEAEFERDPKAMLRTLLYTASGDGPLARAEWLLREGEGFLDLMVEPKTLPAWLRDADLEVFADAFKRTGFRGGLNWYRNIDRNWLLTAPFEGAQIRQPALFLVGSRDPVIEGPRGAAAIKGMQRAVPNLKMQVLEGAGHWLQQERPEEINRALLQFLPRNS